MIKKLTYSIFGIALLFSCKNEEVKSNTEIKVTKEIEQEKNEAHISENYKGINFNSKVNFDSINQICDFLANGVVEKTFGVNSVDLKENCTYHFNENSISISLDEDYSVEQFIKETPKDKKNSFGFIKNSGLKMAWKPKGVLYLFFNTNHRITIDITNSGHTHFNNAKSIAERLLDNLPKK